MNKRIILIDNNIIIRHALRIILNNLFSRYKRELSIFTAKDGVQGLGYIFIIKPDVIVLDLTLPKYSGREILDYITTNESLVEYREKIILLYQNKSKELTELDNPFTLINKQSKSSATDIIRKIDSSLLKELKGLDAFALSLADLSLRLSARSERMYDVFQNALFIFKPLIVLIWFIIQFVASCSLTLLTFFQGKAQDDNIDLLRKDTIYFRTRYAYPSLAIAVLFFSTFILQLALYVGGGIFILKNTDNVISSEAAHLNNEDNNQKNISLTDTTAHCVAGDEDQDGKLTLNDFAVFALVYGKTCASKYTFSGICGNIDSNGDSILDLVDFASFASRFGEQKACNL